MHISMSGHGRISVIMHSLRFSSSCLYHFCHSYLLLKNVCSLENHVLELGLCALLSSPSLEILTLSILVTRNCFFTRLIIIITNY